MKFPAGSRQSTNVQDKTKDAGASFPHASTISNPMAKALRQNEQSQGKAAIQKTMKLPKGNPFRQMLNDMNNPLPQQKGANIPIPTPRPDPNSKAGPKTFGKG